MSFRESRLRSFIKSLVYRVLSLSGTAILTWFITGDMVETITITLAIQVFLIVLYYIYERIWDRINWGRNIETAR
ncbi:DUF2061 domain-containing protein [Chloroflexota bacterium]